MASIARAHHAAERIDLANEMSFRGAADRWIARHVRNRVSTQRAERRRCTPARRRRTPPRRRHGPAPITITSKSSCCPVNYCQYRTARRYARARRRSCARPTISSKAPRAAWRSASTNSSGARAARCRARRVERVAALSSSAMWRVFEIARRIAQRLVAAQRRTIARAQFVDALARSRAETCTASAQRSGRHPGKIASCSTTITRGRLPSARAAARRRRCSGRSRRARPARRSATSRARRARATPSRSTISRVSREPAVSTSVTGTPSMSTRSVTGRASCPASSVTIARSTPASALNRLDLPAFGRPAITTVRALADHACRAPRPPSSASIVGDDRRPMLAPIASRLDEVIALVGKIERRLELRDQIEQRRVDRARCASSASLRADRTPRAPAAASPRRSDRATASAWTRSRLPFRNARSVNSPGSASRAPARDRARDDRVRARPGLPCALISTTSSPV